MKTAFTSLLLLATTLSLTAQVAPRIVADGFVGLVGIDVAADGRLWIGEMGTGNDDGRISTIDTDGTVTVFMDSLPSALTPNDELAGPYRAYQMPDDRVMVLVGEGSHPMAESALLVDKADFSAGNPLHLSDVKRQISVGGFVRPAGFMLSNPFTAVRRNNGDMYFVDSGANSVVRYDSSEDTFGIVTTLLPFANPLPFGPPVVDPVPTKLLDRGDGTFFLGQLTGFPFPADAANVYILDTLGNLTVYADSLTTITDLAIDPRDGNLCVLHFADFGEVAPGELNFAIGSAAVLKLYPDGTRDTLAQGIGGLAPGMAFDPEGRLYVTDLAFGQVLEFDLTTTVEEVPLVVSAVRAYPNPAAGPITLDYRLPQTARVGLTIFDARGRAVAQWPTVTQSAGLQRVTWAAADAAAGTYFYRLSVDGYLSSGVLSVQR